MAELDRTDYHKEYYKKNAERIKAYRRENSERINKYNRDYYRRNKERIIENSKNGDSKLYSVYYLPEEHYIGITNNIRKRKNQHNSNGKITDGFEVIAKFERMVDAHWFETMFHQRGYNGFQYK